MHIHPLDLFSPRGGGLHMIWIVQVEGWYNPSGGNRPEKGLARTLLTYLKNHLPVLYQDTKKTTHITIISNLCMHQTKLGV